jgi:hypothetical protein
VRARGGVSFLKRGENDGLTCDLVVRAPDSSKIKQKMLYASSKDALRKKLVGIATEIQATDLSELSHDAVLEKVSKQVSDAEMSVDTGLPFSDFMKQKVNGYWAKMMECHRVVHYHNIGVEVVSVL